ncbi:CLCA_X family protein [uncultured Paraglaciecola sp.]|mgnify:FL=1|uniref:CLCA_X family protein n=1 Tax=uncultured Paraglaciecola sp. TaxID=1765024 RepID=UPI0030DC080B
MTPVAAQSRLHRPYYRNGTEHRAGADVSFHDIVKIFGFRTINIGKWVTPEEQQIAANLFFDAFCDLMDILQVPESVISLNGTLSLAFGTGGRKHSCAHYESQTKRLALAKNAGGGALAHEWFHAFDHYVCDKLFVASQAQNFASELWLDDHEMHTHPLNKKLSRCFENIFLSSNKKEANQYVLTSAAVDKEMKLFYFARPQELAARAFEAMVQDHSIRNAFLVQGTKKSPEAKLGIYPIDQHRLRVQHDFLDYFAHLGQAIEHKSPKAR